MKFYLDIPITFPGNVHRTFDLIVPDGNPTEIPLLVWIHGGGWCGGEKRVYNEFERFTYHGYAVLSIDYRFSQDAPFPAQLIDCKSAIRWARANAQTYGYSADRIIVGGSSAGGHLAALLGVTNGNTQYDLGSDLSYSSDVQGVADFFGPVDLVPDHLPNLKNELFTLLQNDPTLIQQASPIQLVSGNEPPFLILQGIDDPLVPVEQSRAFYKKLSDCGCIAKYLEIPGGIHGFDTLESYQALTDFILKYA